MQYLNALRFEARSDTIRKVGEAWYIVELADLSVRDNSAETNRKHTWACVQIGAFIINEKNMFFHQTAWMLTSLWTTGT